MFCVICKCEYSDSVYPIHIQRCKPSEQADIAASEQSISQADKQQTIEFPKKKKNQVTNDSDH